MPVITIDTTDKIKRQAPAALSMGDGGLQITPVTHPCDGVPDSRSRTFWSATGNALYIVRQTGIDVFGATPGLGDKLAMGNDLVDHGRRGPIGYDVDAVRGPALWQAADLAALAARDDGRAHPSLTI